LNKYLFIKNKSKLCFHYRKCALRQQHGPKLLAKPTRASGGSPALPTTWAKDVVKAGKNGGESPYLPTALAHAVGKAGNFFPFSFAVF
jgi:hypothetical protein